MPPNYDYMVFGIKEFCLVPFETAISAHDVKQAEMEAPFQALCDMQAALSRLSRAKQMTLTAPKHDDFVRNLNQCFIGAIQDTCVYTPTLSLYVAHNRYSTTGLSTTNIGLVLHFEPDCCTATIVDIDDGDLDVRAEFTQRKGAPCPNSFGFLGLCPFVPEHPKDPKQDERDLESFLAYLNDQIQNIQLSGVAWIEVFVTGPMCDFYSKQSEQIQADMEYLLGIYMSPIKNMWPAALLAVQYLERRMELLIKNVVYASLYEKLSARQYIKPSTVLSEVTCGHIHTYIDIHSLVGVNPKSLSFDKMLDLSTICDDFVEFVQSTLEAGNRPILALHSGFALALNDRHLGPLIRDVIVQSKSAMERRKTIVAPNQTPIDAQSLERLVQKLVQEKLTRATVTFNIY